MKYLVISDIHGNAEALEATLAAAAGAYDRALVLGDLVGYGADPNAVIERVRALQAAVIIRGNHDKVGAGVEDADNFNHVARQAIEWTAAALTTPNREWLASLAQGPAIVDADVEICHGTPFDEDVYVFDDLDALRALRAARRPLCLFGHTHVPAVHQLSDPRDGKRGSRLVANAQLNTPGRPRTAPYRLALAADTRHLVNCGAVGQPRDGDWRAAYGVFDAGARSLTLLRTEYDVAAAQAKIVAAGLPEVLAQRLGLGH